MYNPRIRLDARGIVINNKGKIALLNKPLMFFSGSVKKY